MNSNHTNRHRQQGGIRPEFKTAGLVATCPLTSLNPLDNRSRLFVFRSKINVVGYFENREELR